MALDFRATIKPKPNGARFVFGDRNDESNILNPFYSYGNGEFVFPYTPMVQFGGISEYEEYAFTHTNYRYFSYNKSYPNEIQITGDFTAQTQQEAEYTLAVMHFLKSIQKSYFGVQAGNLAGTPPPVMLFSYLGRHQFNNVPVIIKDHTYTLENNVDYVPVIKYQTVKDNENTYVPTKVTITLTLDTYYTPDKMRDEFNLDDFREGKLLDKGYI